MTNIPTVQAVTLSRLIQDFRVHVDDLVDSDEIDAGLGNLLADIDKCLGRIERALANFRVAFDAIAGRD